MLDIWNFVHGIIVQKNNAVCLWNNVSKCYVRRPSRSRLETNSLNPYVFTIISGSPLKL